MPVSVVIHAAAVVRHKGRTASCGQVRCLFVFVCLFICLCLFVWLFICLCLFVYLFVCVCLVVFRRRITEFLLCACVCAVCLFVCVVFVCACVCARVYLCSPSFTPVTTTARENVLTLTNLFVCVCSWVVGEHALNCIALTTDEKCVAVVGSSRSVCVCVCACVCVCVCVW